VAAVNNHSKVSLRDYLDAKFAALKVEVETGDKLLEQRIGELEKRIDERTELLLAQNERDKVVLNERLGTMNEFRGQLRDQASTFVTREILDEKLKVQQIIIDRHEAAQNVQEGRISQNRALMAIAAIVLAVMQIAAPVVFYLITKKAVP